MNEPKRSEFVRAEMWLIEACDAEKPGGEYEHRLGRTFFHVIWPKPGDKTFVYASTLVQPPWAYREITRGPKFEPDGAVCLELKEKERYTGMVRIRRTEETFPPRTRDEGTAFVRK